VRATLLVALALGLLVLGVSAFYPSINRVHVVGASHYSEAEVLRLAGVHVGDPLLRVSTRTLKGLTDDPWILGARVFRRFPGTLYIEVEERSAALRKGATSYALDGTVLPNAARRETRAVTLRGWGPDRSLEALEILQLVAPYEPQMLSYAPSGFTVSFSGSSLFTPDVTLLKAHWSAFVAQRADSVAVYPWGVSVQ